MNNQVEVLVDTANKWSRGMAISPIKFHLAWKILKGVIWSSLAYTLPATTISLKQGVIIAQTLYPKIYHD